VSRIAVMAEYQRDLVRVLNQSGPGLAIKNPPNKTQKNPPKKTPKNPPRSGFYWVFLNRHIFLVQKSLFFM
jgi:hypothetical protein